MSTQHSEGTSVYPLTPSTNLDHTFTFRKGTKTPESLPSHVMSQIYYTGQLGARPMNHLLQIVSFRAGQYAPVMASLRCSRPVTPTLCRYSEYPDIPRHRYTSHRRFLQRMHRKARHHAELARPGFLT